VSSRAGLIALGATLTGLATDLQLVGRAAPFSALPGSAPPNRSKFAASWHFCTQGSAKVLFVVRPRDQ
jgi:hypothetical protein